MEQKITITPEQLYFLGTLMQAKYIDYAYVAAMDDIGKNHAMYESEARRSLNAAGILDEDFSGNLEISEDIQALLKPVFFGEFESCIDVIAVKDGTNTGTYRFHNLDSAITMVHSEGNALVIERIDVTEQEKIVKNILPNNYAVSETSSISEIDTDAVERLISVKNVKFGRSAAVQLFMDISGVIYKDSSEDTAESVNAEDFISEVMNIIKEA